MNQKSPDSLPEGGVNRVKSFYDKSTDEISKLLPRYVEGRCDVGIGGFLLEELSAKIAYIQKNPMRRDYAYRIAEIFYTVGDLSTCLDWLLYCKAIDGVEDPELEGLIRSVTAEMDREF